MIKKIESLWLNLPLFWRLLFGAIFISLLFSTGVSLMNKRDDFALWGGIFMCAASIWFLVVSIRNILRRNEGQDES